MYLTETLTERRIINNIVIVNVNEKQNAQKIRTEMKDSAQK